MNSLSVPVTRRWPVFFVWIAVCCLLFSRPLLSLFHLAWSDDTASHILLVPFISAWLLNLDSKRLPPSDARGTLPSLLFVLAAGLLSFFAFTCSSCTDKAHLAFFVLSLILLICAGFVWIFGWGASRTAWFGLAFLIFAVPLPDSILDYIIYGLQAGSAAIAGFLFDLSGTPVLREGFIFRLPKMSIEVAKECSGIRSSIALLILAILVAHFSFRPFWKKFVFVLAGLAMMLVKNGIRIATLTLLANYVDPGFLYGKLHYHGGVVFFLIGIALMVPLYWLLRRNEPAVGALHAARPVSQPS